MEKNNFYIVSGDIKVAREYLENLGFTELIEAKDNNYDYIIIGTHKKLFWKIHRFGLRTLKHLIISKCRETYVEIPFEEFKEQYDLMNTEINQPQTY